ncbi:hypothetical protein RHMOL_Rhmol08G0147300 [Rhododendron molle]|uniref:Uncharacterized protein n=1 Tax=Rhododendron molle TaxID=49168 RepID=A0ACC0MNV1_RHOML|nr:hypothetical protein RHMOL_Rhmol08G0147300 [Rhododendron molle]
MIVEDERDHNGVANLDFDPLDHTPLVEVLHDRTPELMELIRQHHRIRDMTSHYQLQADLIEHQWQMYSQSLELVV